MFRIFALLFFSFLVSASWADETPFYVYGGAGWARSERQAQVDASLRGAGMTTFSSHGDEATLPPRCC